ncbi:hypothetical protein [Herbaspirillum sp. YR522]|uniref:hypothetical protein n=1 Tax=Herbaspirillum sp. YR522 TaxID=1144342 RepID=UPI0012F825F2|nr:hypothetical protein [Herbaspirillum sp. YR522]
MPDPLNPDGELGRKRQRRRDSVASHAGVPPGTTDTQQGPLACELTHLEQECHEVRRMDAVQRTDAGQGLALQVRHQARNREVRPTSHCSRKKIAIWPQN